METSSKDFDIKTELFIKAFKNELTSAEETILREWLNTSQENEKIFNEYRELWVKGCEFPVNVKYEKNEVWDKIHDRILNDKVTSKPSQIQIHHLDYSKLRSRNYAAGSWLIKAAAVFLIAFLSYQLFKDVPKTTETQVTVQKEVEYFERFTRKGEKATIPLGDGTIVYLNAGSSLRYPKFFSGNERRVELQGEAYFDVASNPDLPFKVYVGNTVTEVVGTEFNIYNRNNDFRIVVTEGHVKSYVNDEAKKVDINYGEMVQYSDASGFSNPVTVDVNKYVSWRQNKLWFENTPMKKVFDELELSYDIKIQVNADSIKNKQLTGTFNAVSLDEVLRAISLSMNIDIQRKGNTIIVY